MSDTKVDSKLEVYLHKLQARHAQFCLQRDQTQMNYQQLVGAIFACETMIKEYEENLKEQVEKNEAPENDTPPADDNQGEINNGNDEEAS